MTVKQLKDELKKRNAKGFNNKNKAELIKQLEEICQWENTKYLVFWEHEMALVTLRGTPLHIQNYINKLTWKATW